MPPWEGLAGCGCGAGEEMLEFPDSIFVVLIGLASKNAILTKFG